MFDVEKEQYKTQDDDNLISTPGNGNNASPKSSFRMLSLAFCPYILLFINYLFLNFNIILTIIISIVSCIQFYILKSYDGIDLIGMKWYFQIEENKSIKLIHYAKPDPYVPDRNLYKLFWSLLYFDLFGWFMIFLFSTIFFNGSSMAISILNIILISINVYNFLQCRKEMKKQNEEVAREIMMGDGIEINVD